MNVRLIAMIIQMVIKKVFQLFCIFLFASDHLNHSLHIKRHMPAVLPECPLIQSVTMHDV